MMMNMKTPEIQRDKDIQFFIDRMTKVCIPLKRTLFMEERNEDEITFYIDGFSFSMDWELNFRPYIGYVGRFQGKYVFNLRIWETVGIGNRNHPPEDVDTELVSKTDINSIIQIALLTVAKEDIRLAMENESMDEFVQEQAYE
jgi:hypothetical protein